MHDCVPAALPGCRDAAVRWAACLCLHRLPCCLTLCLLPLPCCAGVLRSLLAGHRGMVMAVRWNKRGDLLLSGA